MVFKMQAEELFDKGEFGILIEHCKDKLSEYPHHAYALWYLGKAHFALKEFSAAKSSLEQLRATSPEWGDGHTLPILEAIAKLQAPETSIN